MKNKQKCVWRSILQGKQVYISYYCYIIVNAVNQEIVAIELGKTVSACWIPTPGSFRSSVSNPGNFHGHLEFVRAPDKAKCGSENWACFLLSLQKHVEISFESPHWDDWDPTTYGFAEK